MSYEINQFSWNLKMSQREDIRKIGKIATLRHLYEPYRDEISAATYEFMNSMKLVIPLHSLYWSIHTKDKSKRRTTFAFIFGVNWLWRCGVTASLGVFYHEIKCNGMTSFMRFMSWALWVAAWLSYEVQGPWPMRSCSCLVIVGTA